MTHIKADIKSYIRLPYFSIKAISKTGYWLGVCHGSFHWQGLPRADRNAN